MSRFAFKGLHYVSWRSGEYESEEALASIDDLVATNVNWAGVLTTWYQANLAATAIAPSADKTPTDSAIRCAVDRLHGTGLKVMLKPHVDGLDGSWRGTFQPQDITAWFESYGRFLAYYADLAERLGVEALAIGTELVRLTGKPFRRRWQELISDVRSRFGGLITYAANAAQLDDEFAQVSFWDEVDLIGLDAYFPINRGWTQYVPVLRKLANGFDKPVIFTEIGYRSIRGAATQPWNYEAEGPADSEEQAASYQAFFDAWALHASWMQGAFFWNWPAETTDPAGTDYSPRGKPAELVLAQNFGVTPELQRARRLEEIRRQVQAGEYKVDPLAVSKALVRHHLRSDEPDE